MTCNLPIHLTLPVTVALNCEKVMPSTGPEVTVTTCSLGVKARPALTSCNVIIGWKIPTTCIHTKCNFWWLRHVEAKYSNKKVVVRSKIQVHEFNHNWFDPNSISNSNVSFCVIRFLTSNKSSGISVKAETHFFSHLASFLHLAPRST